MIVREMSVAMKKALKKGIAKRLIDLTQSTGGPKKD
jgi:hypothetical protein